MNQSKLTKVRSVKPESETLSSDDSFILRHVQGPSSWLKSVQLKITPVKPEISSSETLEPRFETLH